MRLRLRLLPPAAVQPTREPQRPPVKASDNVPPSRHCCMFEPRFASRRILIGLLPSLPLSSAGARSAVALWRRPRFTHSIPKRKELG